MRSFSSLSNTESAGAWFWSLIEKGFPFHFAFAAFDGRAACDGRDLSLRVTKGTAPLFRDGPMFAVSVGGRGSMADVPRPGPRDAVEPGSS